MLQKNNKTKQSTTNQIYGVEVMDSLGYLLSPGLEYLGVLVAEHRSRAFGVLGSSPRFEDFCRYVKNSDDVVLCRASCDGLAVGQVGDSHIQLFKVVTGSFDLYSTLLDCCFTRRDYMSKQQLECFSLPLGDPAYTVKVSHATKEPSLTCSHVDTKRESEVFLAAQETGTRAEAVVDAERVVGAESAFSADVAHVMRMFAQIGHVLRVTGKAFGSDAFPAVVNYVSLFDESHRKDVYDRLGVTPSVLDVAFEYCRWRCYDLHEPATWKRHDCTGACGHKVYSDGERFLVAPETGVCAFEQLFTAAAKAIVWFFYKRRLGDSTGVKRVSDQSLDGFCYLKLFDKSMRESVAVRRGFSPSVDLVCVEVAYSILKNYDYVAGVSLQRKRGGLLHATAGTGDDDCLRKLFSCYGKGYVIGADMVELSVSELAARSVAMGSKKMGEIVSRVGEVSVSLGSKVSTAKRAVKVGQCVVHCTRDVIEHGDPDIGTAHRAWPHTDCGAIYQFGSIKEDSVAFLPSGMSLYSEGFEVASGEGVYVHIVAGAGIDVKVEGMLTKSFVDSELGPRASWSSGLRAGLTQRMLRVPRIRCSRHTAYVVLGQADFSDFDYHNGGCVRRAMDSADHLVRIHRDTWDAPDDADPGIVVGGEWVETTDPFRDWKAVSTYRTIQQANSEIVTFPPAVVGKVAVVESFNVESGDGKARFGPLVVEAGMGEKVAIDLHGVPFVDIANVNARCSLYVSAIDGGDDGDSSDDDGFTVGRCE